MALREHVTNDYANWTQSGEQAWELLDSDSKAKLTSDELGTIYTSTIEKAFTLVSRVQEANLTVRGRLSAVEVSTWIPGRAQAIVKLKDADGVWHVLYDEFGGDGEAEYFLNEFDIASYLSKAGDYILQFTAVVKASQDRPDFLPVDGDPYPVPGGDWNTSYVQFMLASLTGASARDWEKTFDEEASVAEYFISVLPLLELAPATEYFNIVKTITAVTERERLIAGLNDNSVLIFDTGAPAGRFDTDDEDFGHPGMDKTLDEVQFESSAEAPHTVTVYASTDSGLTWTPIGTVVVQRGKTCSVFACITAVKHMVSFRGDGLYLSSYVMYAIPRGRMPKQ